MMDLKRFIRDVPDFPKPGITFKDITPLLNNYDALKHAIDILHDQFVDDGITKVIGIESRGFIFASILALRLKCGFVPIRKPNKLPSNVISKEYKLEYGTDKIEIHVDAVDKNDKVLIVDDLLATGGTMCAAIDLVKKCGAEVKFAAFIVNLKFLDGESRLDCPYYSLVTY